MFRLTATILSFRIFFKTDHFFLASFVSGSNPFPFVILSDGEMAPCLEVALSVMFL